MTRAQLPAKSPCGSCPYRTDVPSGVWDPEEYAKLPQYDEDTPFQPTGLFMCHQMDGRICTGWAGCHDMVHSLGVRIAISIGDLTSDDADALMDYVSAVDLHPTGKAAAEHGMAEIETPTPQAVRTIRKITRTTTGKRTPHE